MAGSGFGKGCYTNALDDRIALNKNKESLLYPKETDPTNRKIRSQVIPETTKLNTQLIQK